jgi:hypothetical protein
MRGMASEFWMEMGMRIQKNRKGEDGKRERDR